VTALAVALSVAAFRWGGQGLFYDAGYFAKVGARIAREGLFQFRDERRTYGYPLFVAVGWRLSGADPQRLRTVVFSLQLLILLVGCAWAARRLAMLLPWRGSRSAVYAVSVLNPILLIAATQVLTDLLSAVLVFLAIVLSIPSPEDVSRVPVRAAGAFGAASLSVAVRPANATILAACVLLWIVRARCFRDVTPLVVISGVLACAIPLLPEVICNARAFGKPTPFPVSRLYRRQLSWGTEMLKYGTQVVPSRPGRIEYLNPFRPPNISTPLQFLRERPAGYLVTLALHAFALFDQDFLFTYARERRPWYRWPLSVANYMYLFLALAGGWLAWTEPMIGPERANARFARLALTLAVAMYVSLYIPVAVENRFSLPVYLLVSPAVVIAGRWVRDLASAGRWRRLAGPATLAVLFLGGCALLSAWISRQAPELVRVASATSPWSAG
jgi:hypothetical protein